MRMREDDPRETPLFRVPGLYLAEFHCPPDDVAWSEQNVIDGGPYVVFPGTTVLITPEGDEPLVANPNHIVFYNPGQPYRRRLISAQGDHCTFVLVEAEALAEIVREVQPNAVEGGRVSFAFSSRPLDPRAFLVNRLIVGSLQDPRGFDPLWIEEAIRRLLGHVLAQAFGVRDETRPAARHPGATATELVDRVKAMLAEDPADRASLHDIARRVFSSPFHLARLFRAVTGSSIHQYRNQLRLRRSLDLIADPGTDLADVALALGYASHGHFTDSFRRAFGVPPSRVRASRSAGRRAELRTMLEVALARSA
jgi:AraC family transcriptional regulator